MKGELLSFSGCPTWQETDPRLRQAVALIGGDAEVVLVQVTTPDDAERLWFRCSPTVPADGRDPAATLRPISTARPQERPRPRHGEAGA